MQIFNFRDGHVTTFRHPSGAYICQMLAVMHCHHLLYLPNAWSQTLQTSKRHTFRVSAFHRCHWFGVKLFPVGCAQDSRRVPLNAKSAVFFWIWLCPSFTIREFFTIAPVLTSTLTVCAEIAAIRRLYIGLRVRYKYYKNIVVLIWPVAAHAPIAV